MSVRSHAALNCGSRASSSMSLPVLSEIDSTPAEITARASPETIAWKAARVVWMEEAQKRVTVAPGTVSRPSFTATVRARFPPW